MLLTRIGGAAVAAIFTTLLRNTLVARRAGLPWRGKAFVYVSGTLFGLGKLILAGEPEWADWTILLVALFGVLVGTALRRREEKRTPPNGA